MITSLYQPTVYAATDSIISGWEDSNGTDATDGGKWDSSATNITVQNSLTYSGSYAIDCIYDSVSPSWNNIFVSKTVSGQTTFAVRGYVYIPSNSSEGYSYEIINLNGGGESRLYFKDKGTYYEVVLNGNLTTTTKIVEDTWLCIEVDVYRSSTVGWSRLYINGELIISNNNANTGDSTTYVCSVGLRTLGEGTYEKVYWDNVVISDSYIGPHDEIRPVQFPNRSQAATGSIITTTLNENPVEGNMLILTSAIGGQYSIASIVQTGVVWARQSQSVNVGNVNTEIWTGVVGAGASVSIVTFLNSELNDTEGVIEVCEYSGLAVVNYLDMTANATGTGMDLTSGMTNETTVLDELWVAAIGAKAYNQTAATNGFLLHNGALGIGNYLSLSTLTKEVTINGTATTNTTTASPTEWAGCIITLISGTADTDITSLQYSSSLGGEICTLSATVNSTFDLSPNGQYQFGWNATGSWVWDLPVNFTSNPQIISVTKTLPTATCKISYMWNVTNNLGISSDSGVNTFTVVGDFYLSSGWSNTNSGTDATDGGVWSGVLGTESEASYEVAYQGNYAFRSKTLGSYQQSAVYATLDPAAYTNISISFYANFGQLPSSGQTLVICAFGTSLTSATLGANCYIENRASNGGYTLWISNENGTYKSAYNLDIVAGKWYLFEIACDFGNNVAKAYIDNSLVIDESTMNWKNETIVKMYLGQMFSSMSGASVYFDNVVISSPRAAEEAIITTNGASIINSVANWTTNSNYTAILRGFNIETMISNDATISEINQIVDGYVETHKHMTSYTIGDMHINGVVWYGYNFSQTQGNWMGKNFTQIKAVIDRFHYHNVAVGMDTTCIAWDYQEFWYYMINDHPELAFTDGNGLLASNHTSATTKIVDYHKLVPNMQAKYTTPDIVNNITVGTRLRDVYTTRLQQMIQDGLEWDYWFGTDGWNGFNIQAYYFGSLATSSTTSNTYSFSVQSLNEFGNWSNAILPANWNTMNQTQKASAILADDAILANWWWYWQDAYAQGYAQIRQAVIDGNKNVQGYTENNYYLLLACDISAVPNAIHGNNGACGLQNITLLMQYHSFDLEYTDNEGIGKTGAKYTYGREQAFTAACIKSQQYNTSMIIGLHFLDWNTGTGNPLWVLKQEYLSQAVNYVWYNGTRYNIANTNTLMFQYPTINGYIGWTSEQVDELFSFLDAQRNLIDDTIPVWLGPTVKITNDETTDWAWAYLNYSIAQWTWIENYESQYYDTQMETLLTGSYLPWSGTRAGVSYSMYMTDDCPILPSNSLIDLKVLSKNNSIVIPMTDQYNVGSSYTIPSSIKFMLDIDANALNLTDPNDYLFSWASNTALTWRVNSWIGVITTLSGGADTLMITYSEELPTNDYSDGGVSSIPAASPTSGSGGASTAKYKINMIVVQGGQPQFNKIVKIVSADDTKYETTDINGIASFSLKAGIYIVSIYNDNTLSKLLYNNTLVVSRAETFTIDLDHATIIGVPDPTPLIVIDANFPVWMLIIFLGAGTAIIILVITKKRR